MTDVTRQQIFAQAAKKLRHDFAALSVIPHSGLKGGEAERIVREFLKGHLPKRFAAGSGFIIDPTDQISKQTDVIVYDALNCPVYRASEDAAIFPADNVAAVIEVKSRLDKEQLSEAAKNIAATKGLSKTALSNLPILQTAQTFGCVFAFESPLRLAKLTEHYAETIHEVGLGRHIDLILVLDRGILNLACKAGTLDWAPLVMQGFGGPMAEGAHIAVGSNELGDDSLDGFLRMLLAQLIHFRGLVGHPGFDWGKMSGGGTVMLQYLTSLTLEKDPVQREQKLKKYAEAVIAEFAKRPVPLEDNKIPE